MSKQSFSKIFKSSGFTLLEILVVLFIIGIALGAAGLSVGAATKESRLRSEATRVIDWFNQARNIATISNKTFKLSILEPNVFIFQDYIEEEWVESESLDKRRFVLSNALDAEWSFYEEDSKEIFIFPDSQYSPFELELSLNQQDSIFIVAEGVAAPKVMDDIER